MQRQGALQSTKVSPFDTPFCLLIGLLFLGTLKPERLVPGLGFLLRFPTYLLLILFALWLVTPKKTLGNAQTRYYLSFATLSLAGPLLARNPYLAYLGAKVHLLGVMFYLTKVTFLNTFEKIELYVKLSLVLAGIVAAVAIIQGGKVTAFPMLEDENDFALFMNVMIPFAFFLGQAATHQRKKLFYYGLLFLFLNAHVLSFSRGGFVGLIPVLVYCWHSAKTKMSITLILVCCIGLLLIVAPAAYWEEVRTIRQAIEKPVSDPSSNDRLYSWRIGWKMFLDHPIIGVGPGNYRIWISDYDPTERGARHWGRVAHSLYVTLLAENGIVGLFLFLGMIYANLRSHLLILKVNRSLNSRSLPRQLNIATKHQLQSSYFLSHACMCALLTYLVTGAFLSVLSYPYFWALTAYIVVLRNAVVTVFQQSLNDKSINYAH